jgi:enediyne biosynthesis protein E4
MNRRRFIGNAGQAAGLLAFSPSAWLDISWLHDSSAPSEVIRFEEIAPQSGLHFVTQNCPTPNKHQIETMTGGVALLDYDGDGYLDIYLVNGAAIPSLVKESPSYWNRLFRNNHDGTFTDVTEKAGVRGAGYGMGVAVGDFDNDGRPDLFVANVNGNQLFHNNGDGTFSDVTDKSGLAGALFQGQRMWSVGGGWFDYNNDGLLDLFVVNYCQWGLDKDPVCLLDGVVRGYCHPRFYGPLENTLYRNNGDGTFTDVSKEMGIAGMSGKGMSVCFADFDGDGFMDAFVANDTTRNLLFHNLAGKRFEEQGLQLGVAYNGEGKALSGMGADFRDVNNDGRPDIWHTAIEHETLPLYLNRGTGFSDESALAGLALATANMSGWGNGMFDFDNDGWKDLFVARSNVIDNISAVYPNRRYAEPNSVFRNLRNGKFQDVSASAGPDFQREAAHRGVAFGDLDNDGRIDAVVTVLNGPVKIFRNVSSGDNHWILLNLMGTKSSRMPIGAQIQITAEDGTSQWNQVSTAVGYASSSDSRVHFGLGKNRRIRQLEIRWPSGIRQQLRHLEADRILTIEEPRN